MIEINRRRCELIVYAFCSIPTNFIRETKSKTLTWREGILSQSLNKAFEQILRILDDDDCCSKFTTLFVQVLIKLMIGIGDEVASVEFARGFLKRDHDVVAKSWGFSRISWEHLLLVSCSSNAKVSFVSSLIQIRSSTYQTSPCTMERVCEQIMSLSSNKTRTATHHQRLVRNKSKPIKSLTARVRSGSWDAGILNVEASCELCDVLQRCNKYLRVCLSQFSFHRQIRARCRFWQTSEAF